MGAEKYAVLTDFGSTYTKVVVAELHQGEIVLTWREPSRRRGSWRRPAPPAGCAWASWGCRHP